MTETVSDTASVEASPEAPPSEGGYVEVDGFLGEQASEVALRRLLPPNHGAESIADPITEIYVVAADGSKYAIVPAQSLDSNSAPEAFVLLDGNQLKRAAREGRRDIPVKNLTAEDLEKGKIELEKPFTIGAGSDAPVTGITGVIARHENPGRLKQLTDGTISHERSDFWALAGLEPPHSQDSEA